MKRSEINKIIKDMEKLIEEHRFELPPFCKWTAADWVHKGKAYDEIRDNMLGWDITDFGKDNFLELGFALITIRNGNTKNPKYKKPYAEKLMMLYESQNAPMHYHYSKMEDIINRGGNDVFITVYNGDEKGRMLDTKVAFCKDGREMTVPAGTKVELMPGESITLTPYMYHDFHVKHTGGAVLLGEISMCNDDQNDNCFYEEVGRFPLIEEDEVPYRLFCTEYPGGE